MTYVPVLLIVEDDEDVRETLVDSLYEMNARIIIAENGLKGLEQIETFRPDAILSDINMPKMNGLEMLRNIRQKGFDTPVVMLSAFGDRANTVEALRLGAMDFLDKPCNIDSLVSVLEKALSLGAKIKNFEIEWLKYVNEQLKGTAMPEALLDNKKEIFKLRFFARGNDKKSA